METTTLTLDVYEPVTRPGTPIPEEPLELVPETDEAVELDEWEEEDTRGCEYCTGCPYCSDDNGFNLADEV